jgi:hypothetical protein
MAVAAVVAVAAAVAFLLPRQTSPAVFALANTSRAAWYWVALPGMVMAMDMEMNMAMAMEMDMREAVPRCARSAASLRQY